MDVTPLRRSRPVTAAAEVTKSGLRRFGRATAAGRPAPDFLVIGAKRGGTTSLWRYLKDHPGVMDLFPRPQNVKGTYFFDEGFAEGTDWYLSHFPTRRARERRAEELGYRPVAGEATPYYLYHPWAPVRARQVVPDALVVALLRDPVERAFSHWKERRRHTERLGFAEALAAEPERLAGEESLILADPTYRSFAHRHESYVAQGCYAPMLERWFDAFGRDRVVVGISEEFYAAPQEFMGSLWERLGLPSFELPEVAAHNAETSSPMDTEVRAQLVRTLRPHIEQVEELLGRSLPWSRI